MAQIPKGRLVKGPYADSLLGTIWDTSRGAPFMFHHDFFVQMQSAKPRNSIENSSDTRIPSIPDIKLQNLSLHKRFEKNFLSSMVSVSFV